ncbi:hypothetical protein OPIT5_00145 (plasmid) [Opitutaceae bacterium TAV5]|nr:hypothetical protein OPIT5_00145 [Opitutaceae bacterium TAV5]
MIRYINPAGSIKVWDYERRTGELAGLVRVFQDGKLIESNEYISGQLRTKKVFTLAGIDEYKYNPINNGQYIEFYRDGKKKWTQFLDSEQKITKFINHETSYTLEP